MLLGEPALFHRQLKALRERGIEHPVRVGVPGPAGIAVLARYAALCGVSACASMWSQYGASIGKLFGTAGPDLFVDRLAAGLTDAHAKVSLHFFPFGGIAQSVRWIEQYRARLKRLRSHQLYIGPRGVPITCSASPARPTPAC